MSSSSLTSTICKHGMLSDGSQVSKEQLFRITIVLEMFPEKAREFETFYDPQMDHNTSAKYVVQEAIIRHIADEMMKCATADYKLFGPIWINGILDLIWKTRNWNPQHPLIVHSGNGLITIEPLGFEKTTETE